MASSTSNGTHKWPLPTQPFIHGKYVDSKGTEKLTLRSAVDDSLISDQVQVANAADVDIAVESAEQALKVWQGLPFENRRKVMERYADLIVEHGDHLGYLETILNGKEIMFSGTHEPRAAANLFNYFAGYVDKLDGDAVSSDDGYLKIIRHEPFGICAGINAYNSPIITFAMKAAPALAAGNVIISKASETNPFSSLYLGELAIQAGIPPGVLNVLIGTVECGSALATHMKIRKISFTGSVVVGKKIQVAAAQSNLKSVTLELGGKTPVIVFPDADIDLAAADSYGFMRLNGQGCVLGTRIFVHEDVVDEYVTKLKVKLEHYRSTLGADPFDKNTISSPLYHHRQRDIVVSFLDQGGKEAKVLTGGKAFGDKGCYIEPTLFYKPKPDARVVRNEIFGPVAVIDTFTDEDDVVRRANDTDYGLGATLYTKDLSRAVRVSTQLEAGTVTVNNSYYVHHAMAFGGWKNSGVGRENGKYGLLEYTQTKSLVFKY
ncbi:aldehyde dehydrogenase [Lepidopterella palustris CBS 459.81]|uniref:aldehyde dehydrogenase (NAD(+)) n=1 Tax=Lepidopterella palustris CBS 459.81 TaxID=1314670 RepID=A0A8E2E8X3_9PEZI|nr:aldehyde dehydrogenase [Lepidopterella palustris CBS 459.81]